MNRRRILALMTGGSAAFASQFASAAEGNSGSPTAELEPSLRGGSKRRSRALPDLKLAGPSRQVRSIAYWPGAYSVTTEDGKNAFFLESDLRFKIDSSDLGPEKGKPVIAPAGTEGDRAWVFFSTPQEIGAFIQRGRS